MRAILVEELGGPGVLTMQQIDTSEPARPTSSSATASQASSSWIPAHAGHGRADGVLPLIPGVVASGGLGLTLRRIALAKSHLAIRAARTVLARSAF